MGTSLTGLTPSTTYDGLIKLSDNEPLGATAKYIGDGLGNDSILSLSTTKVGIGTSAPTNKLSISGAGGTGINFDDSGANRGSFFFSNGGTFVQGFNNGLFLGTIAAPNAMKIDYQGFVGIGENSPTARVQVKGSGSTSATTSLLVQNSAGSEALRVYDDRTVVAGVAISAPSVYGTSGVFAPSGANGVKWGSNVYAISSSNGILKLSDNSDADFNRLQFGGTTSSFPAIKKASNNIEIRNADDTFGAGLSVGAALNASAILQADSTTKGFLPPRMTTTQKNAIASPAAGLMVYDTTLAKLCVYTTAWETITSI